MKNIGVIPVLFRESNASRVNLWGVPNLQRKSLDLTDLLEEYCSNYKPKAAFYITPKYCKIQPNYAITLKLIKSYRHASSPRYDF